MLTFYPFLWYIITLLIAVTYFRQNEAIVVKDVMKSTKQEY
jgi:hypothetical protein